MDDWKQVPGYDGFYLATKDGKIWSTYKNDFMSENVGKRDGYVRVSLKDNTYLLHRLIATTFFGKRKGMQVNHKDGDKTNNCVDNLEWVTQKENAQHCANNINEYGAIRPTKEKLIELKDGGLTYSEIGEIYNVTKNAVFYWMSENRSDTKTLKQFELLEGEIAKSIPGFRYYFASNFGRILSLKSGKALKPQIQPNGYTKVGLVENGKRSRLYIHRLIMAAFHGESGLVVNHINRNRSDNRLRNLEYVTQSNNAIKSSSRKLSVNDYYKIFELKESGMHRKEIAQMFDICDTYVNKICRNVKRGIYKNRRTV